MAIAAGSTRREELLSIAARLFAGQGYAQTSVRDIADAAGILSGSLYHHFSSKEAMLQEILGDFMNGLYRRFAEVASGDGSPRERFAGLVRVAFHTIDTQPHAVALYQHEYTLVAGLPGFEFLRAMSRLIQEMWIDVLDAGRAAGEFRDDFDPLLTYFAVRDAGWSSVRWYRPDGALGPEELAEHYLQLFLSGLSPHPGPSPD